MAVLKRYFDEDEWFEVTETEEAKVLERCYLDGEVAINDLKRHGFLFTDVAEYKWQEA